MTLTQKLKVTLSLQSLMQLLLLCNRINLPNKWKANTVYKWKANDCDCIHYVICRDAMKLAIYVYYISIFYRFFPYNYAMYIFFSDTSLKSFSFYWSTSGQPMLTHCAVTQECSSLLPGNTV